MRVLSPSQRWGDWEVVGVIMSFDLRINIFDDFGQKFIDRHIFVRIKAIIFNHPFHVLGEWFLRSSIVSECFCAKVKHDICPLITKFKHSVFALVKVFKNSWILLLIWTHLSLFHEGRWESDFWQRNSTVSTSTLSTQVSSSRKCDFSKSRPLPQHTRVHRCTSYHWRHHSSKWVKRSNRSCLLGNRYCACISNPSTNYRSSWLRASAKAIWLFAHLESELPSVSFDVCTILRVYRLDKRKFFHL